MAALFGLAMKGLPFIAQGVDSVSKMAQNNKSDQTFRDGWTQQQLDPLSKANPGKNIMIICVKHDAHCLQGVQNQTLECQCPSGSKLNYTVYIFDEGDFWIQGDGGYLNWAFTGSYVRDGKKVTFKKM